MATFALADPVRSARSLASFRIGGWLWSGLLLGLLAFLVLYPTFMLLYGAIRAALEARGESIGNNDLWIAAHAKASALTLVTNNEREFKRVAGLKVQNWAE